MASKPYFTIVTNVGTSEMLSAINEERKVNITEFAVGDGDGSYYTPDVGMTALKREVWRGNVNSCKISKENENVLEVESIIPSDVGGFTVREMALFDDKGNMIAICNTPDTMKVKVSDGVAHELSLSMEILLSNTDSVELVVDPNVVTATKKDLEDLRSELNEKIDNINSTVQEEVREALKVTAKMQDNIDDIENNMLRMGIVLSTLSDADCIGSDNIVIENLHNADDIIIRSGSFDAESHRLYA
ncbi:MAG: phage tail protein [Lachnospiraceae bacterium]|nr:phage tail protein [Lachnospiraceae bacterium]